MNSRFPHQNAPTAREGLAICIAVMLGLTVLAWGLVVGLVALGEML